MGSGWGLLIALYDDADVESFSFALCVVLGTTLTLFCTVCRTTGSIRNGRSALIWWTVLENIENSILNSEIYLQNAIVTRTCVVVELSEAAAAAAAAAAKSAGGAQVLRCKICTAKWPPLFETN